MNRTINPKDNPIIYPLDRLLKISVDLLFIIIKFVAPKKYTSAIEVLKTPAVVNVFGLTLFNALGGLLLIATNIKLANVLGASLFGLYSYFLAIGEVGSNWTRYGRHKTQIRDLVQFPERSNNIISNTFCLSSINLLFFVIVVLLFHSSLDFDISLAAVLLIFSSAIVSLDLQPVYESINMMSWHSIYYLMQKILFLVGIGLILLFKGDVNLLYIGILLFSSWSLVVILQIKEIFSQFRISFKHEISFNSLWRLYKTNFIIALSCLIGVAFGPLIRLVLQKYVDSTAVGIYSAGFQIYLMSQFVLHQISRVGNPVMAEIGKEGGEYKRNRQLVKKYLIAMLCSTIPFFLPLLIVPNLITDLLFSEEYVTLSGLLPFFGVYLLVMAIGVVYEQLLISLRKDCYYLSIYVGGALLTIIASVVLVPLYGLLGGVIAFTVPGVFTRLLYVAFGEVLMTKMKTNEEL